VRAIQPNDIHRVKAVKAKRKQAAGNDQYAYEGPLGQVVHKGRYFFAWRDGFLIGTYHTLEQAMESLVWRERLKTRESK
jgi:hypothetical protein